jgi:hypothetical protein
VITSSFAAIVDGAKGNSWTEHTYSEKDWNPVTEEEAYQNPSNGYRGKITISALHPFLHTDSPHFLF